MSTPEQGYDAERVELLWLPLGAGDNTHCVKWNGHLYEAVAAWTGRRERCALYHAALQVQVDGARWTIEMGPAWGLAAPDRGVVLVGPVGLRLLGRWRAFRYEIRRWRGGVIPDADEAVGSPVHPATDAERAARLLDLVALAPAATWGRDELGAGEMWNSNSLVSWLLVSSGHDAASVRPPDGGRAPGWDAGLVVAGRAALDTDPR